MLFLQNLVQQFQVVLSPVITVRMRIILLMYVSTPFLLREIHVPTRTQTSQGSGGVWVTKPFQNWKKAVEKIRTHERNDNHKKQIEAESTLYC